MKAGENGNMQSTYQRIFGNLEESLAVARRKKQ